MAGIRCDMELAERQQRGSYSQFQELVRRGNIEKVRKMGDKNPCLIKGVVDSKGKGKIPLNVAVKYGHEEVAMYLFKKYTYGAVVSNNNDETPLYIAVHKRMFNLLTNMLQLLGHSDINKGKSILHAALAVPYNWKDYVEVLLNHQSNLIESHDEQGFSPLSTAIRQYDPSVAIYLLSNFPYSSNIQDKDNSDKSYPIHQAMKRGQIDILEAFYNHARASIGQCNGHDQTILHLAASSELYCKTDIMSFLVELSEIREILEFRDDGNYTAIERAVENSNTKFLMFFN